MVRPSGRGGFVSSRPGWPRPVPATGAGRTGWAGYLALAEALRGGLGRAAELAGQATLATAHHRPPGQNPDPAPMVALAWVHVQRNELRETRSWIKQADAALGACPDKLIGAMAYLVAADGALAEGRAPVAVRVITRARSGWPVPAWLDQQLNLAESRAYTAAGDIPAAVAAAKRADGTSSEAMVMLARAWVIGGDVESARQVLDPVLAADDRVPDRVRVQALLVDARLGYSGDDGARGRRSLASALHLAEREQLRLPLVGSRAGWAGTGPRPRAGGQLPAAVRPGAGPRQLRSGAGRTSGSGPGRRAAHRTRARGTRALVRLAEHG